MTSNGHIWEGTGTNILGVFAFLAGLLIAAPFMLLLAAPFMPGL
jgi:hypothetical protein